MDFGKDFKKYALGKGISSMNLHYFEKNLENGISPENSLTPYILEERDCCSSTVNVFRLD